MGDRAVLPSLRAVAVGLALTGCAGVQPPEPRRAQPAAPSTPVAVAPPPKPVPKTQPDTCGIPNLQEAALKQVNLARAAGRSCGAVRMRPVKALVWEPALAAAAWQHSADMANRNYFDHISPDGRRVGYRVASEGYNWRTVGENLAGGDSSLAGAIRGWLGSPAHCQNLMNPAFAEVGLACVHQANSQWGFYWTLVLAAKR